MTDTTSEIVRVPSLNECRYPTLIPIEHFEPKFAIGTYGDLKRAGIHYVEQIAQMTRTGLMTKLGRDPERKIDEIIDKLEIMGFELLPE